MNEAVQQRKADQWSGRQRKMRQAQRIVHRPETMSEIELTIDERNTIFVGFFCVLMAATFCKTSLMI